MLEIYIPGIDQLKILHLVLDYNGTLAVEGNLIDGIDVRLNELAKLLDIHVLTGDTFGKVKTKLQNIHCKLTILSDEDQAKAKQKYVQTLGAEHTIAIGNGRNDRYMLKDALIGIAVLGGDGTAAEAIMAANVISTDIFNALDLIQYPRRLVATLRS